MRYGRMVFWLPVLLGCGYAAAAFQDDIYQVVCKYLYPPYTRIGAVIGLGFMGAGLGMVLPLGLAPPSFLRSREGEWWVRELGRGGGVVLFRTEMLGLASVILLATAAVLVVAFLLQ